MKGKSLFALRGFLLLLVAIAVVAVALEGEVWAIGIELGHVSNASLVDGHSDYSTAPSFGFVYFEVFPSNDDEDFEENVTGGTITLSTSKVTKIEYTDKTEDQFSGSKEFNLSYLSDNNEYILVNSSGAEASFGSGAETGFSESPVALKLGTVNKSNTFPALLTTQQQLNGTCYPYVELITEGEKVTGVRWRFVNPSNPSVALARSNDSDIRLVYRIRLRELSGKNHTVTPEISPQNGDILEGTVKFDEQIDAESIEYVRIGFEFANSVKNTGDNFHPYTFYQWRFYNKKSVESSSGGCDTGSLTFFGLIGLTVVSLKKVVFAKKKP